MTPQELNQRLVGMVESVAAHLLPNGKRVGKSWCNGSIGGEEGQSLRLCLEGAKAGLWTDFSSNEPGGDLLSLWQKSRGLTFVETLKEAKDFAGVVDDEPKLYTPRKKKRPVQKPKCEKVKGLCQEWLEKRNVHKRSVDAFKVAMNSNTLVFPFISPEGALELVKYRHLDKEEGGGKKHITSNSDPDYHLWGYQAINPNDRDVVICEGEIDAMSWHMQGFPALSVPNGANSTDTWLSNDFERLQRFETIYLSMDMDEAGQSAIQPIITRLGIERCKIVDLGEHKDANEAHVNGELLARYLGAAKTQDPQELTKLSDHHEKIMDEFKNSQTNGLRLPWSKTYSGIRLRPSEISIWAGINSHGKSIALSQVAVEAVAQGHKVCIASMEMKPRKLGRKMYQQLIGKDNPSQQEGQRTADFLGENMFLFEVYGTAKADRIIEVFNYARKRYGVTHFQVDSLSKCGLGEDDYNGQKALVDRLMEFAGEHDVHVHLVVHIRKLQDESKIPGKFDVKGTGAITDMVDNVFIWWRNKPKEEGAKDAQYSFDAALNCVKQRETGEEPLYGLYFHKDSCQFTCDENEPPKQYV